MKDQLADSFSRLLLLPACETLSGLFLLSREKGYGSENFVNSFMQSVCAADMDNLHDVNNWMGHNYAMDVLEDELGEKLKDDGEIWPSKVLEWMAFVYRHWSAKRTVPSSEIFRMADAATMREAWFGYHTLDIDDAIDNLAGDSRARLSGSGPVSPHP